MTINRVDLIELEDFIQQILKESTSAYVLYVIMIESCFLQVQLSQMAQILASTTNTITLPEVYKDFENVFSTENAGHLPLHEGHDHVIDLINSKKTSLRAHLQLIRK